MECLDTLIGLSQTTCDCYPAPPAGYNNSDSGVYIDEAKGFSLDIPNSQNDCKNGDLWEILDNARKQSAQDLTNDLNKCLRTDRKDRYGVCNGFFTTTKLSGTSLTTDFVAIKIKSSNLMATCLNITSLGLMATSSGTIDYSVYSSEDLSAPISGTTGSFNVSLGGLNNHQVDFNLPLYLDGCVELEYYLVYALNGVTTKSNKIWCKPCSGGSTPCYDQFFCQSGVGGDDTEDIENWEDTGNLANGIVYYGEVACKMDICDYLISDKNYLYYSIATAMQYKAAECVYYNVLYSSDFSKYTTLDRECLEDQVVDYSDKYDETMEYICEQIAKQGHPCLVCDNKLRRSLIHVTSTHKRGKTTSNTGKGYQGVLR